MKNTAKIKLKNRIRKLLSDKRGFSLGELLAATVILLLASQVMERSASASSGDAGRMITGNDMARFLLCSCKRKF